MDKTFWKFTIIYWTIALTIFGLVIAAVNMENKVIEKEKDICESKDLVHIGREGAAVQCINTDGDIKYYPRSEKGDA